MAWRWGQMKTNSPLALHLHWAGFLQVEVHVPLHLLHTHNLDGKMDSAFQSVRLSWNEHKALTPVRQLDIQQKIMTPKPTKLHFLCAVSIRIQNPRLSWCQWGCWGMWNIVTLPLEILWWGETRAATGTCQQRWTLTTTNKCSKQL